MERIKNFFIVVFGLLALTAIEYLPILMVQGLCLLLKTR